MDMAKVVQREKTVVVRLTNEMYEKLERYADQYGHATSSMAAIAVASWVVTQERAEGQIKAIGEAVASGILGQAEVMAKDTDVEAVMKAMFEGKKEEKKEA